MLDSGVGFDAFSLLPPMLAECPLHSKRRKLIVVSLLLFALTAMGAVSAWWALFSTPDFYEVAIAKEPTPEVRKKEAERLVQTAVRLVEEVKFSDQWSEEFTEQEINSWLAQELETRFAKHVPRGVSKPRVKLTDGLVRVGFRLKQKDFNGVVSLHLKPWIPQPNQLAIRVISIRAGLLPVPLDKVLIGIRKRLPNRKLPIQWKQADGDDVVIVYLDSAISKRKEIPVLEAVEVGDGIFRLSGSGADHLPVQRLTKDGGEDTDSNSSRSSQEDLAKKDH